MNFSPTEILKKYWGFDAFRPLQEEIIHSVLNGNDTLALMPTGGGKSLCYQVPAFARDGLCLVISPLIALMKDQVENLRKKGITAFAVYSGMSRKEVINTFRVATESNCKFLYLSPERLETALFREYLPALPIRLLAVDEAHCISQWGYDFRPPYLRISALREQLPGVPVLALTASATPEVQQDICDKLNMPGVSLSGDAEHRSWSIFRQSFERPNLSYSVFKVESKITKIIEILRKVPGSSIIYCKSRKRTKEICELLKLQGAAAGYYHAGLEQEVRNKIQSEWVQNQTRVIVCTNAFGMGIDKPDVRIVIHADVPDCLEHYYQEAGRAGRDGKTAFAVLLYDEEDLHEMDHLSSLRFPSLAEIRNVYQSVANYLQIPAGSGEGQYFDFDISDFLKKFRLQGHHVLFALKALEQEGLISFNEQVFLPATVRFTVNKEMLYEFEKMSPSSSPLVKTLLRAYEGIFDQTTAISEKSIAGLMKKDPEEIKNSLTQLHKQGIIEYMPQKDKPQLLLLQNRMRAEEIQMDMKAYRHRKEQYEKRIKKMLQFVTDTGSCRSRIIGAYFGDSSVRDCAVCDNCLRKKRVQLSKEEFETLYHRILNTVKYESLQAKELLQKLNGIKKEKAWKVLEFLQAENKIEMDASGWVKLK